MTEEPDSDGSTPDLDSIIEELKVETADLEEEVAADDAKAKRPRPLTTKRRRIWNGR